MMINMMAKRFVSLTIISSIIILLIGSFFLEDVLGFALGVALGCLVSVLKILLLARSLDTAVNMEKKDVSNYMRLQYTLRYSLTTIGLIGAALIPIVDLFGAIGGVLSMYLAAYMMKIFFKDDDAITEKSEFQDDNSAQ